MTTDLNYCLNGCTRRHGETSSRVITEGKSQLCTRCEDRLHEWLKKIPDTYALVPLFIEHGSTDANPEGTVTKRTDAQPPMRLDPIDILDTRRGRIWLGTVAVTDRRGAIGVLQPWVELLRDERPLSTVKTITVSSACELLDRHRLWLAERDYAAELYDAIKKLNRTLSDAVGDYRQKPVGRCTVISVTSEDTEPVACGGALFPQITGGVSCAKCQAHTPQDHLRILGAALSSEIG